MGSEMCIRDRYPTEYVCVCVCVYLLVCIYLLRLQSMSVCVCMCVWLAVSTPCVSTPSVCIYCVCVYLLHLLKTLTNAPALIAPTQLLAASGRRDEALYQALGARLRTRRVRAVRGPCTNRTTIQGQLRFDHNLQGACISLLYTTPRPRPGLRSRMPKAHAE